MHWCGLSYACENKWRENTRYVVMEPVIRDSEFACRVKYTKPSVTTFPWEARNDAENVSTTAALRAAR